MMEPMVSIVIPFYNAAPFLKKTVDSVLCQTYQNIEVLLVNDCSADESLQLAQCYANNDSRVRIIDLPQNKGVANARNTGIAAAKGTYIALLDSDDTWEPEKIQKQVSLLKRTSADIAYCSFDLVDSLDQRVGTPIIVPKETHCQEMLYNCVFNCCTAIFKAGLLKEHPFRLDQYHEDYVLWIEIMSLPAKAVGVQEILAHNRQTAGSRSHNKFHAARERWKIYRQTFAFGFFKSLYVFTRYGLYGMKKYYT